VTATLRPLFGAVIAAFIALSLIATALDAVASTPTPNGGSALFDQGVTSGSQLLKPRPIGRFGVSWE